MKSLSKYLKTDFYTRPIFNIFLISIIYALFITGYRVFISDQTQYLILPFRNIFPEFCVNDWFVWETSHYHFSFSYLIQFIYYLFMGSLEIGIFVVWFVFLIAHIHSLYFLTRSLGGEFNNFIVVVFLLATYSAVSFGDSITHSNILMPSFMAVPVTTYAFAFLFFKRYKIAFLFLGIAALIHVNFGVIGLPVFIIYLFLSDRQIPFKTSVLCIAIFLLVSLPTIIPTFLSFKGTGEWLWLAYLLRGPHHYNPLEFGAFEWIETLFPAALAIGYFIIGREGKRIIHVMGIIICLFTIVLIINLLNGPLLFHKIYVWRFAPYLLIFSYIILSKALFSDLKVKKSALWYIFVVAAVFLIMHRGLDVGLKKLAILLAGFLGLKKIARYKVNFFVQTLILVFLIVIGNGFKGIDIYNKIEMMEWIKKNTQTTAIFLTPPNIEGFRILTHRPMIVNIKCVPIGVGSEMYEWKTRLEKVTNSTNIEDMGEKGFQLWVKLTELYLNNSPEQVKSIMSFYNTDYFITYTNHKNFASFAENGFNKVYQENHIAIFHLSK